MWAPMPGAGGCFYLPLLLNQLHCLGDYLLSWYLHNARDCSSALLEEAADACRFLPSISITLDDKNDGLKLKAGARDPNYLSHIFFSFLSPLSILFFMLKCKRLDSDEPSIVPPIRKDLGGTSPYIRVLSESM